ncbi:5-dehydro-4-deoxyglucarate dehydratase [Prauserella cavernicola]|uniref:Probable 5-dehydro-4-deoxyglucarate dehydratase n=1 Tax=Prauserella cavernicola TaxID=2800127 RepID=A0A934QV18_9PSEU|nr:5-dehydro-4-deoxyglucarate dehydratase [Prauserella cavernicola]MBK1786767.1 5-dehydro-4-deoxyglucarate dehydratase [Prauserella cavernicola]
MTATYTAEAVERLQNGMATAVLSFPLTPFHADGAIDTDAFRAHVRGQLAAKPGALFPCCGTGEFFSLAEDEYETLITIAVEESAGTAPVVAGAGYGWAQAGRFVAAAQRAGADAVLLMPPYLVETPQAGLVDHVRKVAENTELPLIVYQRAQVKIAVPTVAELATIPNVIGIKDGHCDLDQLQRIKLAAPPEWLFFNGAATAEMQARSYRAIGVPAYSSAVHAFAPEISQAFFRAFHADDHATVERLLSEFFVPLVELRDKGTGYAVALVKAAARLRGATVGPVRAPLRDLPTDHLEELDALLTKGLALVGATR